MKKSVISLFLAISLILGAVCCTPITSSAVEDYRDWSQYDERWASIPLGTSSCTVASSGCLVTSVTKLAIQAELKSAPDFNVSVITNWLNNNGGFTANGDLYWAKAGTITGLTYYGNLLSKSTYDANEYNDKILQWIYNGYHMAVQVNNFGHWICIDEKKSVETGKIYIMDSLKTNRCDVTLAGKYGKFNRISAYTGGKTYGHVHDYNKYVYYYADHPHYNVYKCVCGSVKAFRNEPRFISTCSDCKMNLGDDFYATINCDEKALADTGKCTCAFESDSNTGNIWHFKRNSDGSYVIKNALYGDNLELSEGAVSTNSESSDDSQKWYVARYGGNYTLISKADVTIALDSDNVGLAAAWNCSSNQVMGINECTAPEKPVYLFGDLNMDGELDVRDVTCIQKNIGIETISTLKTNLCDLNFDGIVNVRDVTFLQCYLVSKKVDYPVNADGFKVGDNIVIGY